MGWNIIFTAIYIDEVLYCISDILIKKLYFLIAIFQRTGSLKTSIVVLFRHKIYI